MKTHDKYEEDIPLYAAGQLPQSQRNDLEKHLTGCKQCQQDLLFWKAVSEEVLSVNEPLVPPDGLPDKLFDRMVRPNPLIQAVSRTWQLLRTQVLLVRMEIWPASAIIMLMGVIVSLVSDGVNVIHFIAPLVTATTLAVIYGPENDPGYELSLATVTHPWKILLARASIVSFYNFLLALAGSVFLLLFMPSAMLGTIIFSWLGPMAFLSSLALFLSVWLDAERAVLISYGLWILQFIPFSAMDIRMHTDIWIPFITVYQSFWHSPVLLLFLSLALIGLAVGVVSRSDSAISVLPG